MTGCTPFTLYGKNGRLGALQGRNLPYTVKSDVGALFDVAEAVHAKHRKHVAIGLVLRNSFGHLERRGANGDVAAASGDDCVSTAATRFDLKVEIVGGVAKRGFSNNDLDLLVTGGENADLEAFLNSLQRLQISHEPMSVPGGPIARLFLADDREIDIFYR